MDEVFPPPQFQQPFDPGTGTRGRTAVAVTVAVLLVVVVVALTIVFFTGVVRIGTPGYSNIKLTLEVDRAGRPVGKQTSFTGNESRVYCCARAKAFEDTVLESRWSRGDTNLADFKGTFGRLTGGSTGKFLAAEGNVAFYLDRPSEGWTPGSYTVELLIDGRQAGRESFTMPKPANGQALPTMVTYEDTTRHFSIRYPEGWEEADPSSLSGGLVGFMSPSGGEYPPRFAIAVSDFSSTNIDYLNGILTSAGAPPTELFTAYSLGDRVGARRTFEWDYKEGDKTHRLKSIQVVVQGRDHVYSLDCHSLASEFDANLPVMNAIINSFRLSD